MPHILSTASALPEHRLDQERARTEMARLTAGRPDVERLVPIFNRSGVETRYLVHPPDWYLEPRSFEERNREYRDRGLDLAEQAARLCLDRAGVAPAEVDHLLFVTTTGLATPSLDALLAARLGMASNVRRTPIFGLGCAGGAGALARARDVLSASPRERALVVSVELCSLVFSRQAMTPTDLVGVALFGDGAAAVLVGGDDTGPGPSIAATRTHLFSDAQHLMGWDFTSDGMRLVLSRDIPDFVGARLAPVVNGFLDAHGLSLHGLNHYMLHPGGRKVLATYHAALGLPDTALAVARQSMRCVGNLSSASVLFMLHDVMSASPARGDTGLMLALGPGFACEMLLLAW